MEQNPWTTLHSRQVYENPWIRVVEHEVLNPAGNPGIYGVVQYRNAAVGVAPVEDGCLWLVGQYRYPLARYSWEIPEGGAPPGEAPLQAAQRELKEETGFSAARWEKLFELHTSNAVCNEWGIVYLATGLTPGEAQPEETEALRLQKVPIETAFARVEAGEITDSLSVAAIYKLMLLLISGRL